MLRLTIERRKRGWSQAKLGRRSEIDASSISRLEAGKLYAYAGWRRRLGRVLEVPGDRLFEVVPEVEVVVLKEVVPHEQHARKP